MNLHSMNTKQTGATLMEVLVAMSISLVVTASMIALMANSLSSTSRIIQMTKLTDDMRVALQMMSRDVRRSSYNANSMFCYANADCEDDGIITLAADITINTAENCFTFLIDRDYDGDATNDEAGGFRRVTDGTIGVIEMWTGDESPNCADAAGAAGWVQITDPATMDIFAFTVNDDLSVNDPEMTLKVRKITMDMEGRLVLDNSIMRHVEDVITVRNDLLL